MARLVSEGPVRKIGNSRRALTGQVCLAQGGTADFESALERDWILCLDFLPHVQSVHVQPFTINYDWEGEPRTYTPDALARYVVNGQVHSVVYEVKYREDLKENWSKFRPRFKAAVRLGRAEGWKFRIVTECEIRTRLLDNARFLKRFKSILPDERKVFELKCMLQTLGDCTPIDLLRASYWREEDRAAAVPYLWHLIATRAVMTDLNEPLTMRSPIWLES